MQNSLLNEGSAMIGANGVRHPSFLGRTRDVSDVVDEARHRTRTMHEKRMLQVLYLDAPFP